MKTKTGIFAILLAGLISSHAQDTWTRQADVGGTPRYAPVAFSIGSKGYIGTGNDGVGHVVSDFWEYDPATNTWTQKADFGGDPREAAASFAIGNKGYVGTGGSGFLFGGNLLKDFWEYDPTTNIWTRKADFGGVSRFTAVGFSIGTKGYIGTGTSQYCCPENALKDIWEYDPATDTWIRKADFGGGPRTHATGFNIGGKGYIGTGQANDGINRKDFWEFDPIANTWSQKADLGGPARNAAMGFSIGGNGYIGTGDNGIGGYRDFWEYEPIANTWSRKADFGGSAISWARGFAIGGKGYGGTGIDATTVYKDFWEYTPGDSGGSGPCIPPPAGLVSWWSGDRTADDVQDTNNGTLRNGTSFRKGMVGPAFSFDGVDDYVQIPHNASLNPGTGDFSVNFWMKTDTLDTQLALLNKRDVCLESSFWSLVMLRDGTISVEILQGATNNNNNTFFSDISVNDGIWHHVALVRQTTTATLYIDGAVHGSGSTEGITIVANTAPVLFATDVCVGVNGSTQFYSGELDEIQYLDAALTASQIQDIYNAGAAGQCKPEIFVSSITPSYEVVGHGFLISTSIVIQDENGIGIEGASVLIKTILPGGSVLAFPATTDATGEALISFAASDTGLYRFTVQKVSLPSREYDRSLNIETTDTLLIP